jgi:hypothetical protein
LSELSVYFFTRIEGFVGSSRQASIYWFSIVFPLSLRLCQLFDVQLYVNMHMTHNVYISMSIVHNLCSWRYFQSLQPLTDCKSTMTFHILFVSYLYWPLCDAVYSIEHLQNYGPHISCFTLIACTKRTYSFKWLFELHQQILTLHLRQNSSTLMWTWRNTNKTFGPFLGILLLIASSS